MHKLLKEKLFKGYVFKKLLVHRIESLIIALYLVWSKLPKELSKLVTTTVQTHLWPMDI